MSLRFAVEAEDGAARRGRLTTAHGVVETPAFMPVGTRGAVKGLLPGDLAAAGATLLLANLYHLALRPGIEVVADCGGLHRFIGWRGPLLTDSGGYQVFSLAPLRSVDASGVEFRSHLDGDLVRFTPAGVVEAQERLGVDMGMMLDECPSWPLPEEEVAAALERTVGWARSARERWEEGRMALFGIVQGGVFPALRERAARELVALDFAGYGIGGVSVGEPAMERRRVVEHTAPLLPADRPRYLMGVGTPADLLHAVRHGVDLFDCVLPSRNARHGVLFTRAGVLRIKNAVYRQDPRPVEEGCPCDCCRQLSRAFLHHLFRAGEITAAVAATRHNIRFFLDFVGDLRKAITSGDLARRTAPNGRPDAARGSRQTREPGASRPDPPPSPEPPRS